MPSTDPRARNLGYFFRESAAALPDKVAVIDLSGGTERRVTFAGLDAQMNQVASFVADLGMAPGERLALAIGNRHEFLLAMFGAMRAGIVPVPLNIKQPADVLAHCVADAGCTAAVIDPDCGAGLVGMVEAAGIGHRLALGRVPPGWMDFAAATAAASAQFAPIDLPDDAPAFHPYTSGSTGKPKGVILTHACTVWWIEHRYRHWPAKPDERQVVAMPLYHKNAMTLGFKPKLKAGASCVLMERFEPRAYLENLARFRATEAGGVPAVLSLLLKHRDLIRSLDLSSIRAVRVGSAPVHEELMRAAAAAFGGVPIGQGYGLTETAGSCLGPPLDGRPVPLASVGVEMPGTTVKLVDAAGREGDEGELWIRSPANTPGYHNLPEVNAQRFADGFLKTGDLFRRDAEGFYYFTGRADDMFNSGGENVYPKEVENVLLKHPDVVHAAVVPHAHPEKGEVPVAMVVLVPESRANEEALKRHCLANGPSYAHPRRIVIADALPLSGVNKIDYRRLKTELADLPLYPEREPARQEA